MLQKVVLWYPGKKNFCVWCYVPSPSLWHRVVRKIYGETTNTNLRLICNFPLFSYLLAFSFFFRSLALRLLNFISPEYCQRVSKRDKFFTLFGLLTVIR